MEPEHQGYHVGDSWLPITEPLHHGYQPLDPYITARVLVKVLHGDHFYEIYELLFYMICFIDTLRNLIYYSIV